MVIPGRASGLRDCEEIASLPHLFEIWGTQIQMWATRLLEKPEPKDTFKVVLEQARARHQARIYAYVVMPDHLHPLINEPPAILLRSF